MAENSKTTRTAGRPAMEGDVCEISDEDYERLKEVAPAAFDGNDIITL